MNRRPTMQSALTQADDQDEDDVELELVAVVRLDRVVDDRGRDQDQRDRSGLRGGRRGTSRRSGRACRGAGTRANGRTSGDMRQVLRPPLLNVVNERDCPRNPIREERRRQHRLPGDGGGAFRSHLRPRLRHSPRASLEDVEFAPFLHELSLFLPAHPLRQARDRDVGPRQRSCRRSRRGWTTCGRSWTQSVRVAPPSTACPRGRQ